MEGIRIEIVPDKPEKTYQFGEKISGEVKVHAERELLCEELSATLECEGFSAGRAGTFLIGKDYRICIARPVRSLTLFKGKWSPGSYGYRFAFDAPRGPQTYIGQILTLNWLIKAAARLSSGEEISTATAARLMAGGEKPEPAAWKSSDRVLTRSPKPRNMFGCIIVSLAFVVAGAYLAVKDIPQGDGMVFGAMAGVPGLVMTLLTGYQHLINMRIAAAETWIASRSACPGDIVPCGVTFTAKIPMEIEGVSVIVQCEEEAGNLSIHTSSIPTAGRVIYKKKHALRIAAGRVPAGVPVQAEGEFEIPADAAPSFELSNSIKAGVKLGWRLDFAIEMKKWPDWIHLEDISVKPERRT